MGSSIRRLTQFDELVDSDQVPINSDAAGGDVRVPISLLIEFIQSQLTVPTELLTQYASPNATAFSIQIDPPADGDSVWLLLDPAAAYADGGIVLPAQSEAADRQEVLVNCTEAVTTFTVGGNGATVLGAPSTLAANAFFRLRYDGVNFTWFRVG